MSTSIRKHFQILGLAILLVSLVACKEKKVNDDQTQNSKSLILDSLQNNQYNKAIELVDQQIQAGDNSSEMLYYKASALAKRGGIDIFTLYPIFEMKLFSTRALDWDELNKLNNPYKRFFTINTERLYLDNDSLRDTTVSLIEKSIQEINSIDENSVETALKVTENLQDFYQRTGLMNVNFESVVNSDFTVDYTRLNLLLSELRIIMDDLARLALSFDKESELKLQDAKYIELNQRLLKNKNETVTLLRQLKFDIVESNLSFGANGIINFNPYYTSISLKKITNNIMDILWTSYQTLPMLAKLPRVNEENKRDINESLVLLETIYDRNDEYRKNSGYYLSFLSAIMFVNTVINMSDINFMESMDFICGLSEEKMRKSVSTLNFYMRTLEKDAVERSIKLKFFHQLNSVFQGIYNNPVVVGDAAEKHVNNLLGKVKAQFCQ